MARPPRLLPLLLVLAAAAPVAHATTPPPPPTPGLLARLKPPPQSSGDRTCLFAVAPDGQRFYSGSSGPRLNVWNASTGKLVHEFNYDNDPVRPRSGAADYSLPVACARDGKTVFSVCHRRVCVHDAASGRLVREVVVRLASHLSRLDVTPDGKTAAVGGDDHDIALIDLEGETQRTLSGHEAYVTALAFSPDGKTLASGSHDRTIRLWDVATGQAVRTVAGHEDQVAGLAFRPDGKALASAGWDRSVRLWDLATFQETRRLDGHRYGVYGVAFAPDGKTLASGGNDGTLRLWDAATGRQLRSVDVHPHGVLSVAFLPDGRSVVTGDAENAVRVWATADGEQLNALVASPGRERDAGTTGLHCLDFSPDGRLLVTGGDDQSVHLFDVKAEKHLRLLGRHPDIVWSVAFAPDGRSVASVGRRDGSVRRWEPATGRELPSLWRGQMGGISRVAYHADGRLLLAAGGSFDPTLYLWDPVTGARLRGFAGHTNYVDAIAVAPDGRRFASAGRDGKLMLWAINGAAAPLSLSVDSVHSLAYTPDGRFLVRGSDDGVFLCDPGSGRERRQLAGSDLGVETLALSRDGRMLAAACTNVAPAAGGEEAAGVIVWELSTGRLRQRFILPSRSSPHALRFSPDGTLLATAGRDDAALVWDVSGLRRPGVEGAAPRSAGEAEALWRQVGADDAAAAHLALGRLALAPALALALVQPHLKPAVPADPGRVARLLGQLDDNEFAVRERATAELEQVVGAAEVAVRKYLETAPSVEAARRARRVLERLDGAATPGRVRTLRALELVERVGTPEARRLFEELAAGAAEAELTREARAALGRLARP